MDRSSRPWEKEKKKKLNTDIKKTPSILFNFMDRMSYEGQLFSQNSVRLGEYNQTMHVPMFL